MKDSTPSPGYKGILHHWKDDLGAAISVSLVALPLCLGIALASGAPAMSGILSAIIGGLFTTFFRGSHVAINGPAAGLIVVVLSGVETLGDENGSGFPYVLAAIVFAGAIQVVLGLLKMGKLGDLFPSSVINGMLATIGITIFAKQFHIALGVQGSSGSALHSLLEIPNSILQLNPLVTSIAIISIVILSIHPHLNNGFLKSIPGPLQVLIVSVPLVFIINLFGKEDISFLNYPVFFGREYLIDIPDNLLDNIIYPDFSKVHLPQFWLVVISIMLVSSIATLIMTKAVDKLDHYKRRTDLNKDLFAIGLSTSLAGFLGGLPIITVIVRSSVNVNHNAKTKWSNLYHGAILLGLVVVFPYIIREIPQACLAGILVFTGYKLASPSIYKAALQKGWEQLAILVCTVVASLAFDLLWGIMFGIVFTLLVHWLKSQLNFKTFIRHLLHAEISVSKESSEVVHVSISGIANFAMMLRLINSLKGFGNNNHYVVDFSRTKLVDSTVLEFIHEHREKYFTQNDFEFTGLDVHKTSSPHPLALHVIDKPMQKPLTGRQNEIYHYARENDYRFSPETNWYVDKYRKFKFFEFHLLEHRRNRLMGVFNDKIKWEIVDIIYNDGILMAREEHQLTVMVLNFEEEITEFLITKDNARQLRSMLRKDQNKPLLPHLTNDLSDFLSENHTYYIEGIDKSILIWRRERLLSTKEILAMHDYGEELSKVLPDSQ